MNNNELSGLINTLNENTVEARQSADSWEEAVELVGGVMVKAGIANESYIEAMKRTIRELGPYCVIAPGIAMPHARPDDGVIRAGFSLVTLTEPVEFGSSINDPVDIVIGLAAVSKEGHIEALRELAAYLGEEEFVKGIREAKTTEELLAHLQTERNKK